jgi:hypothetical protein
MSPKQTNTGKTCMEKVVLRRQQRSWCIAVASPIATSFSVREKDFGISLSVKGPERGKGDREDIHQSFILFNGARPCGKRA